MNIFYLDPDPAVCARMHCDAHVVKMMTEYLQILSTSCKLNGVWAPGMYRVTHANHPSVTWAAFSPGALVWLHSLAKCTLREYTRRYGKQNLKGMRVLSVCGDALGIPAAGVFKGGPVCGAPPQVMPADCFHPHDTVAAYRMYYNRHKARFARWRMGDAPGWFKDETGL